MDDLEKITFALLKMAANPGRDKESEHYDADYYLLAAIRLLGRPDIADAYEKARDEVGFWYA